MPASPGDIGGCFVKRFFCVFCGPFSLLELRNEILTSKRALYPSLPPATDSQTYEAMVLLRVEMLMLAGADVFSGTFSSNLGRIVAFMRETSGKPRESALSSDVPLWFAGRL